MKTKYTHINHLWAELIIDTLVKHDLTYFCIGPGSRSTPLTLAVADNPKVKAIVHTDERGLGFHALGYAKATQKPAVVITTSGTAVANLLPSVVEASMDQIPMIILSADRPPELQNIGANQTIHQPGIFGVYTNWDLDFYCPDESVPPEYILKNITKAISKSQNPSSGPVHINLPFREPLVPIGNQKDFSKYLSHINNYADLEDNTWNFPTKIPDQENQENVEREKELLNSEKGIIVIGKLANINEAQAVDKLIQKLAWPVFADPLSLLRLKGSSPYAPYYDLFVPKLLEANIFPDVVLQIGGKITSKRLLNYLESSPHPHHVQVLNHAQNQDPINRVTKKIIMDMNKFCDIAMNLLESKKQNDWHNKIINLSIKSKDIISKTLKTKSQISELAVVRNITELILDKHGLFVSNSLPIRLIDMAAYSGKNAANFSANRGASGIDGIIATATGYAQGLEKPVTLLIGDQAFLHDLNSLHFLSEISAPLIIIVMNNNGGEIFSLLTFSEDHKHLDKYFRASHNLDFKNSAQQFNITYYNPQTEKEFVALYKEVQTLKKSCIIEINVKKTASVCKELFENVQNEIKI